MKLIAESGATKTDWAVVGLGRFRTAGLNLSHTPVAGILDIVAGAAESVATMLNIPDSENVSDICPLAENRITDIIFYGAGLVGNNSLLILDKALKTVFPGAAVAYGSDLLAASRAAFRDGPGIVAILGTGSNSCFYDGSKVVSNVRPGGFILGDEGGGVSLGRTFIADFVKGLLPENISASFTERYGLTYEAIVENVYRGSSPAAYLASFVPFILEHRDEQYVKTLIDSNFRAFITRCLKQYDLARFDVAVVGSFGCVCKDELIAIGGEYGVRFTDFIKSPIDRLVEIAGAKQPGESEEIAGVE